MKTTVKLIILGFLFAFIGADFAFGKPKQSTPSTLAIEDASTVVSKRGDGVPTKVPYGSRVRTVQSGRRP
jgi:hypothetical protein